MKIKTIVRHLCTLISQAKIKKRHILHVSEDKQHLEVHILLVRVQLGETTLVKWRYWLVSIY